MRLFATGMLILLSIPGFTQTDQHVMTYGTLRGIMGHDLAPKVQLSDLQVDKDFYGLGAAAGLDGELLILAGEARWTHVEGEQLTTQTTTKVAASLLVVARVSEWTTLELPDTLHTQKDLETFLLDLSQGDPFPFLLEGQSSTLDWHVINWDPEDEVHTHEKHKSAGFSGHLTQPVPITILGFHSTRHRGVFTHHSTTLHMHVKLAEQVGHVDGITISPGTIIKLPTYLTTN